MLELTLPFRATSSCGQNERRYNAWYIYFGRKSQKAHARCAGLFSPLLLSYDINIFMMLFKMIDNKKCDLLDGIEDALV